QDQLSRYSVRRLIPEIVQSHYANGSAHHPADQGLPPDRYAVLQPADCRSIRYYLPSPRNRSLEVGSVHLVLHLAFDKQYGMPFESFQYYQATKTVLQFEPTLRPSLQDGTKFLDKPEATFPTDPDGGN